MPIDVLSLGAGVQSTCLLLMSCRGVLPRLDAAVFADTGWEPREVYAHLDFLRRECEKAGIPLVTVSNGNLRTAHAAGLNGKHRCGSMPVYVLNPDGSRGQINRECTEEYKVGPITKYVRRELLGLTKGQRSMIGQVRRWFGISTDEARRIRQSRDRWAVNVYPLCGLPEPMLPRTFNRSACVEWLRQNYPGQPIPRSACLGCPYHSNAEWRHIRDSSPEEWEDVCQVDEAIRHSGGMRGEMYLHSSCRPLRTADLGDEQTGQLFGSHECMGVCWT